MMNITSILEIMPLVFILTIFQSHNLVNLNKIVEKTIDLHIFFTLMQGTELFKKASQLSLKRVKRAGFA